MSTIEGFVEKLNIKRGDGQYGPWAAYSAKIQAADGTTLAPWFQFGFNKPPIEEGDWVKFEDEAAVLKDGTVSTSARSVVKGSASKPKNAPARPAATSSPIQALSQSTPYRSKSKTSELFGEIGGYYTESDIGRITWAGARKDAVQIVTLLLQEDALKLTKGTTPSHRSKRYEELLGFVDKVNVKLFFDNANLRLLDTVDDEGAVEASVEPLPENDEEEVSDGNGVDTEEAEEKF